MRILILIFVLLCINNPVFAKSGKCNREDAHAADDSISTMTDWKSIYKHYEQFAQCDDGAIAEGYDGAITYQLLNNWGSTGELHALMSKDKQFSKFVLEHIRSEIVIFPEEANQFYLNVRTKCPIPEKQLCKRMEDKLDEATKVKR